ncbi:MAG: hypothetical protein FD152_537 [Xanthobacteraceae bacterium]|nr:MAG: hypothetical protein FD152_537 [Xanthobacteraceae bacterium]
MTDAYLYIADPISHHFNATGVALFTVHTDGRVDFDWPAIEQFATSPKPDRGIELTLWATCVGLLAARHMTADVDGERAIGFREGHILASEKSAAEITRLRALVEEMGKALEPFAKIGDHMRYTPATRPADVVYNAVEADGINSGGRSTSMVGHFHRARTTLAKAKEQS